MLRADCGFNQVAPPQLTPSSALEHVENADTLWDRKSLRIGGLPLDPIETKIGTKRTSAQLPHWQRDRTFIRLRLGTAIYPERTFGLLLSKVHL